MSDLKPIIENNQVINPNHRRQSIRMSRSRLGYDIIHSLRLLFQIGGDSLTFCSTIFFFLFLNQYCPTTEMLSKAKCGIFQIEPLLFLVVIFIIYEALRGRFIGATIYIFNARNHWFTEISIPRNKN